MFKRLMITTDGSAASERAIRHGIELARCLGATVLVVRVTGLPAHIVVLGVDVTELPESVKAEIDRTVAAHFTWAKGVAAEARVSCVTLRVEAAHPWQAIIDTAQTAGADLIVMASHGRSGRHLLPMIGSETQRVVTHSPLPVLVLA